MRLLLGVMALGLFVFPLIRLLLLSLGAEDSSWSLEGYRLLVSDERASTAIVNTIYISIASALISSFLGTLMAFLVGYTNIHYKKIIEMLIFLPFVIPAYVMTISWTGLTSPGGALTLFLKELGLPGIDLYTMGGNHRDARYLPYVCRLCDGDSPASADFPGNRLGGAGVRFFPVAIDPEDRSADGSISHSRRRCTGFSGGYR